MNSSLVKIKKKKIGDREFLYKVYLEKIVVAADIPNNELAFDIKRAVLATLEAKNILDKLKINP